MNNASMNCDILEANGNDCHHLDKLKSRRARGVGEGRTEDDTTDYEWCIAKQRRSKNLLFAQCLQFAICDDNICRSRNELFDKLSLTEPFPIR